MKANFQNILTSSFLLYIDHTILKRGDGYTNVGSKFFPISGTYNGFHTYAAPFKQIVSDASISGANQLTGIYLDNTFIVPGQSGLVAINHYDGQVIFSNNKNSSTISGNYAIKDFNVYLTDKSEDYLLFSTKMEPKNRKPQTLTGLAVNEITYPAIFLRLVNSQNEPFALGGTDMTSCYFRALVMSNSMYNLDAACGILRDSSHDFFRTVSNNDLKLNAMSSYTGSAYNYTSIATGDNVYVSSVSVSQVKTSSATEFKNLNPDIVAAFVDFDLEVVRAPHAY